MQVLGVRSVGNLACMVGDVVFSLTEYFDDHGRHPWGYLCSGYQIAAGSYSGLDRATAIEFFNTRLLAETPILNIRSLLQMRVIPQDVYHMRVSSLPSLPWPFSLFSLLLDRISDTPALIGGH